MLRKLYTYVCVTMSVYEDIYSEKVQRSTNKELFMFRRGKDSSEFKESKC